MEAIVPLLLLVVGLGVAIWVVRTFHRPKTSVGRMEAAAARFPPGTRAFEASMSLGIIADMIASREREIAKTLDEGKRATLTKQVSNLEKQRAIHQRTVDARDLSRGKMSIGVNPDSDTVE
ncbi:MAG: hypothetical protein J0L92_39890 [Deltaproteobacteria bacterium]|nr:hypothetical protein [Deltaproteobacteria bacterium]